MSDFDEAYERTVARVLSEHVEHGVSDSTDLWPTVQKRLAEHEGAVEQPREHRWFDWLMGVASPRDSMDTTATGGKNMPRVYRYAQLAVGLVGLLLLTAVTTFAISRLAANPNPDKYPVISTTVTAVAITPTVVPVATATNVALTPIADLATLVNSASYIARVKLAPARNNPPNTVAFDLEPGVWFKPFWGITTTVQPGTAPLPVATAEWFRPASGVVTGNLRLEIFYGVNREFPYPDTLKDQSVTDYILFFNHTGSYAPNMARYELADVMAGVFAIRDGKISYAGIGKYNGLPVENLEQDIHALLSPTAANKDLPPISLGLEGEGFRIQAPGGFGPVDWLGSSNLLVQLAGPAPSPQAGSGQALTTGVYLLDLTYTRTLRPVALGASAFLHLEVFPDRIGYYAALVGTDSDTGRPVELSVLDVRTGEAQAVYSPNPSTPQWVNESQRGIFGNFSEVSVSWLGQDTFVATLMPIVETGTDTELPQKLGKLVLVDIGKRSVQLLSERGRVAATLQDGSVVVQNGWIDGELQLFEPPYTGQPKSIAPKGPWRVGWGAVDGGVQAQVVAKVAWLEMAPPPGDWSNRLPHACCSGDPSPKVEAIVVWDRPTGQIQRFPVSNYSWSTPSVGWSQDEKLRWSIDWSNPSLFYTANPRPEDPSTLLYRLGMDGKSTLLAKQEPHGTIKVVGEGNDGLYYEILGYQGQNAVQLMLRSRDGKVSVVRANSLPVDWVIDANERLLSRSERGVSVKDLNAGFTWQITVPGEPLTSDYLRDAAIGGLISLSPGTGSWAVYRNPHESENGPVQVVHIIKSR